MAFGICGANSNAAVAAWHDNKHCAPRASAGGMHMALLACSAFGANVTIARQLWRWRWRSRLNVRHGALLAPTLSRTATMAARWRLWRRRRALTCAGVNNNGDARAALRQHNGVWRWRAALCATSSTP